MTYTISTEPVTEEHIGRRVLVRDEADHPWEGPYTLTDKDLDMDWNEIYFVEGRVFAATEAILIVETRSQ